MISCPDKPPPLDQAVTRGQAEVSQTTTVRLSLLLSTISDVPSAANKVAALAAVTRICVEWVDHINPRGDALSEIKARAESDPGWGGFTVMASLAGEVAASIDDSTSDGPEEYLLAIAQYALSWAAQIIEEES